MLSECAKVETAPWAGSPILFIPQPQVNGMGSTSRSNFGLVLEGVLTNSFIDVLAGHVHNFPQRAHTNQY